MTINFGVPETSWLGDTVPLLVALVGAGVGAYFAVIKNRNERLWTDRYEALREVVLDLEIIETHFNFAYLEQMGVSGLSVAEVERLRAEWPVAMLDLRKQLAKLQILFKAKHVSKFIEQYDELESAFGKMYMADQLNRIDAHNVVSITAYAARKEAIAIAQSHCVK